MTERKIPTREEVESYLHDRRNWGRWGDRGAAGAINLITPEKRRKALSLARTGRTVSMSRPFAVDPSPENPMPSEHYMKKIPWHEGGGAAVDYYGSYYHGYSVTHLDALCHTWDSEGMWDGRDPDEEITFDGARYAGVEAWSDGILTRGVLLDVPKHRGKTYVSLEEPLHGWELEDIAREQGVAIEPGDALVINCGRDAYAAAHGGAYAQAGGGATADVPYPGLHASCLPFIRDHDVALVAFDMEDLAPNEYGLPWTIHGVIFSYGVALLDNCQLGPLAQACAEEGRYEFMLFIAPLVVIGGTGSPVNPIAVL